MKNSVDLHDRSHFHLMQDPDLSLTNANRICLLFAYLARASVFHNVLSLCLSLIGCSAATALCFSTFTPLDPNSE